MSSSGLDPIQKYYQFCNENPQYKNMGIDKVCSIMVEQKIISASQITQLKNSLFFKSSSNLNKNDGFSFMGLDLTKDTNFVNNDFINNGIKILPQKIKPRNYVEQTRYKHPIIESLEVLSSGKIDPAQFSVEALKEKYDDKNYKIVKNPDKGVTYVETKNGQKVFSLQKNFLGNLATYYGANNLKQVVNFDDENKILDISIESQEGEQTDFKYYRGNPLALSKECITDKNGNRHNKNFDRKTGKVEFEDFWEKGGFMPYKTINYSNGIPYKIARNNKPEYVLVKDLAQEINKTNIIGIPVKSDKLEDFILHRINYENVEETLNNYKKITGNDLLDDLDSEISIMPKTKLKLKNHIEKLYVQNADPSEAGTLLAKLLHEDIIGLGSGQLGEHLNMLTPENVSYTLYAYTKESQSDFLDHSGAVDSWFVSDEFSKIEGLITAIYNESGLSQKEKKNYAKIIIDAVLEKVSPQAKKRAEKDIALHNMDPKKTLVDLYRAINYDIGDERGGKDKVLNNNEGFLGVVKQGRTGDCWLIAALNSVIAKPKMLQELEKLVTKDQKTGDYIVNFRGIPSYRVSQEELSENLNISTGSKKINAIEIAMDKYIRDRAYKDEHEFYVMDQQHCFNDVSIDGGFARSLWVALFGQDHYTGAIDPKSEDFNNPIKAYCFSLNNPDTQVSGLAKSDKIEDYDIISRHEYSIIGSDNENIYCLNPWDSSDKITIKREDFGKLGAGIVSYTLQEDNMA